MGSQSARRRRARGEIEELPSGALRVRVYAGIDPVSGKRHYLVETVPPGQGARSAAEKTRTRLLGQVDERRSPKTKATVDQLLDRWLDVLDVEPTSRRGYLVYIDGHIRPVLGRVQVARLDAEILESFYASLRKCRARCGGRHFVEHRTPRPHECDDRCRQHTCKPLANSSIRQVHWILSGALSRAVRWRWIAVSPISQADAPAMPHPAVVEQTALRAHPHLTGRPRTPRRPRRKRLDAVSASLTPTVRDARSTL